MSRHELQPLDPAYKVTVGWDHPLLTFFIQVIDRAKDAAGDDHNRIVLWRGTGLREIYDIDQFERLARRWAHYTPEIGRTLFRDQDEGR